MKGEDPPESSPSHVKGEGGMTTSVFFPQPAHNSAFSLVLVWDLQQLFRASSPFSAVGLVTMGLGFVSILSRVWATLHFVVVSLRTKGFGVLLMVQFGCHCVS